MTAAAIVLGWPGSEALAGEVASALDVSVAAVTHERFPDGESRVRVPAPCGPSAIVAALDRPDPKLVPLALAADAARGAGAPSVGLVAPYLPYLRQDARFREGDPLSAAVAGRMLATCFDWLVTLEPHLHRIRRLEDAVPIPCVAGSVAEELAAWMRTNAPGSACVGPDDESQPWVAAVARAAGTPHAACRKTRRGDHDVQVEAGALDPAIRRAVLVDDILSTGRTLADAARALRERGVEVGTCLAVHAIFAPGAEETLAGAGLRAVTCDGIAHASNGVRVAPRLAELARPFLIGPASG